MQYQLSRMVAGPFLHTIWRPKVTGAENIPASGGAILAANHQSVVDSVFLPLMLDRGSGVVVNIASVAGQVGLARRAAYCASKGGLVLLTRSLAVDHGQDGIRVNCLCPGLIDTEMADWIRHDEPALARFAATVPARRMGTPEEIADGVAFLASAGASYLHGAVLMVDGGGTA